MYVFSNLQLLYNTDVEICVIIKDRQNAIFCLFLDKCHILDKLL